MFRRTTIQIMAVALAVALVGCAEGDGDEPTLVSAEEAADMGVLDGGGDAVDDSAEELSSAADQPLEDSAVVTAIGPVRRTSVEVLDGVAQFNTAIPIPSLWSMTFSGQETEDASVGMSVYRTSPSATSLAWAFGDNCGTVLLAASLTDSRVEEWSVDDVIDRNTSCESPVVDLFDIGTLFQVDLTGPKAFVATEQGFMFGDMFESFSDHGDPRQDPAGAIELHFDF